MAAKKILPSDEQYLERTKRNQFWMKGTEGQLALRNLKVGVAGLGGMGSNIAEIFARLGVGHLRLADPDVIEVSNINRQVIANMRTVGMTKLEASCSELLNIDSTLDLKKFPEGISEENAEDFVKGLDVVINEIDVLHVDKQMALLNAARKHNIPVYTTLVVGVGIHLYKYSPTSSFTAYDFLGGILRDSSLDMLLETLGQPLPAYMQDENLQAFKDEITNRGGIPIFGASTYLGQSMLVIRVLSDLGRLRGVKGLPETPSLPEFLVLDPLTLELKTALIGADGKARFKN
ncbi:MAG TPA: ThiF family adenylyltransferase [Bdellovibrio sp.]|uniref:HesA/MoeB/ThiF family protein n=1 Tax=Bdellovibrio sp. TaxID=28201 RepID=UPI002F14AC1B